MRFLPALLTAAALLTGVAAPASATLVSTTMTGVEIGSHYYNVTFWQQLNDDTTFNQVFGTGSPSFVIDDQTEAGNAAQIILNTANSTGFDVTPGNDDTSINGFLLAFAANATEWSGYVGWLDTPGNGFHGLGGPFAQQDRDGYKVLSFATLERTDVTPVPEPGSALLMAAALGAAGLARRRRAS